MAVRCPLFFRQNFVLHFSLAACLAERASHCYGALQNDAT